MREYTRGRLVRGRGVHLPADAGEVLDHLLVLAVLGKVQRGAWNFF